MQKEEIYSPVFQPLKTIYESAQTSTWTLFMFLYFSDKIRDV